MVIDGIVISKKLREWIMSRVFTVNESNTYLIRAHMTTRLSAHGVGGKGEGRISKNQDLLSNMRINCR